MSIRHLLLTFSAFSLLATSAIAQTKPAKDYVILKVGKEEVRYADVLEVWSTLFPGDTPPEFSTFDNSVKQNVLRGVVSEKLLYQEAIKQGVDKSPEVQKRLESLKKQLVIQSLIEQQTKALTSDAALKKAYADKTEKMKDEEEVRARHILVDKEEDAKKLYEQIQKGADFAKLAKEKSVDKGSATKGGDLDFFTKDKMVPEFAEAAFKLKKGEVSQPVKSEFGWHIIKVEDRRKAAIPPFEQMKEQLMAEVQQKGVQSYVDGLVKGADVKYYDAAGKEIPFDPATPANAPAAPAEVP